MRTCEQAWHAKVKDDKGRQVQLGSHRIKQSWFSDRYNWVDETGAPLYPERSDCGKGVKDPSDMSDVTYMVEALDEVTKLSSWEKANSQDK